MADITAANQNLIVFYLGYPAKVLVPNSTHYNKIIANRMTNLLDATVTTVEGLLTLITETRTKLDATRDDANVTNVGEIALSPDYVDKYIVRQYDRYLKELSSILDIPMRRNTNKVLF